MPELGVRSEAFEAKVAARNLSCARLNIEPFRVRTLRIVGLAEIAAIL